MTKNKHLASVVITTKNRKHELATALRSVFIQDVPIEVIVIDDGSADGTEEMVRNEFPLARLYREEISKGLIVQRNRGAKLATTNIIISIDDDAYFSTGRIVRDIVGQFSCDCIGAVTIPFININYNNDVLQQGINSLEIYMCSHFTGCSHALRRDIFLAIGGYKEYLFHQGEEEEYCIRMRDKGYIVKLGISDPIIHCESPNRDMARMHYYGKRNLILSAWYNTPTITLPIQLISDIINGYIHAIKAKTLTYTTRGFIDGFMSIPRLFNMRAPVRYKTYITHKKLKKCKSNIYNDCNCDSAP